jgi:hypothetical protein
MPGQQIERSGPVGGEEMGDCRGGENQSPFRAVFPSSGSSEVIAGQLKAHYERAEPVPKHLAALLEQLARRLDEHDDPSHS